MAIRFMKHYVTNGAVKARVFYSNGVLRDGSRPITLYARDYDRKLGAIFGSEYQNETDIMTDYFDQGHVRIPPGHPLYQAALERCQQNERDNAAAAEKRAEKRAAAQFRRQGYTFQDTKA